jgi:hypothetical protein
MGPRIFVETKLSASRVAALATVTCMRATNADIGAIIERTRRVLEAGREAMLEADVVVRTSRLVTFIYSK